MSRYNQQLIVAAVLSCLVLAQSVLAVQRSNCVLLGEKPRPVATKHHYSGCLVAEFGAVIETEDGQYIELNGGVDCNPAAYKCQCGHLYPENIIDQHLTVDFPCATLSMWIGHNETSPAFVRQMDLEYQVNNKTIRVSNEEGLFPVTDLGNLYRCDSEQAIEMTGAEDTKLILNEVSLETYRNRSSTRYYKKPEVCALD